MIRPDEHTLLCVRIRTATAAELFELERELACAPATRPGWQQRQLQDLVEGRRAWLRSRPPFPEIKETVTERKTA